MRTALLWAMTQRVVVIPRRRFGTTYSFHLQEFKISEQNRIWYMWKMIPSSRTKQCVLCLKTEPIGCPETSRKTTIPLYAKSQENEDLKYKYILFYCGHSLILWLFHLGISCTVFVLICTVVVLCCFVMCVCVCMCVCGEGFVMCGCFW
jgi:hypothetical protein